VIDLRLGDCREVMATMEPESVDAIVTDPPYGLEFMGKEWDRLSVRNDLGGVRGHNQGFSPRTTNPTCSDCGGLQYLASEGSGGRKKCRCTSPNFPNWRAHDAQLMQAWHEGWAREVYRVLKPGGHMLAFGGTRTHHRMACAVEDAGFLIEDCIMWMYGQGFPKHKSKLKPAYEPIIVARKGGASHLNIDACRIEGAKGEGVWGTSNATCAPTFNDSPGKHEYRSEQHPAGRWPANVILDEEAAAALDEQTGTLTSGVMKGGQQRQATKGGGGCHGHFPDTATAADTYGDSGGASRFFYCAKASRAEREAGLEDVPLKAHGMSGGAQGALARGESEYQQDSIGLNRVRQVRNNHPTVKPVALMQYLCRLVTPPGGLVLDPFCGSGSTGIAALREGFNFFGIEREPEHIETARRRIIGDAPMLNREEAAA
jgi:DNA modification methylase